MNEQKHIYLYQLTVAVASALLMLFLIIAWIVSGPGQEWKKIQKDYSNLIDRYHDTASFVSFNYGERGIHQYEIIAMNRTDRCVTCHAGIEHPGMADVPQPFTSHPGDYFLDHPPDKYGCTICHGGQGRALNSKEAHGIEPETHWEHPVLSQPYIQSSCGQCHLTIFTESKKFAGTEVFQEGQEIFNREGCLGCHKARGVGGIVGPDLTEQGEKTRHEYSFQNIETEQTVSNWLKEHFRDPEMVSPGSQMLRIDLPEEDLDALTTFVLGLAKPDIEFEYFSLDALREFKGFRNNLSGSAGYSMICSGCHGKEGRGKSYREFKTGVPAIQNPDFLRVVSDEYIEFTLLKGRSQRQMASWATDISGLESSEIQYLTSFLHADKKSNISLFSYTSLSSSDTENGKVQYLKNCATCHGNEGTGGVAIALNQPDLLKNADNTFLFNTLLTGRGNAMMPSWQDMDIRVLYAIVKYIRSWQSFQPQIRMVKFAEPDPVEGKLKFHFMCSRCHGEYGQGQTGPAIINSDFLEVASDEFLYSSIAYGRRHSAMFGWSTDVYNNERLEKDAIGDIITFMRKTAGERPPYIYSGANRGDMGAGRPLFQKYCAECHGEAGEGPGAPALNNQELLSAASNGYLMATITIGREGTAMPEWGRETESHVKLTGRERQDIVAFVRGWERIRIGF